MNLTFLENREFYLSLITRFNHVQSLINTFDDPALITSYKGEQALIIALKNKLDVLLQESYLGMDAEQFAETKS